MGSNLIVFGVEHGGWQAVEVEPTLLQPAGCRSSSNSAHLSHPLATPLLWVQWTIEYSGMSLVESGSKACCACGSLAGSAHLQHQMHQS